MTDEQSLSWLVEASAGDPARFGELVAPYRRELEAHCYRMTGSLADAEDVVQESLVRAWRGLPTFEGRSSLRTWLHKIATHGCLDELERRPRRAMPSGLGPPSDPSAPPGAPVLDPIWLDPCPDALWQATAQGPEARCAARQSVAVAFLAALQLLPPLQRAVLLLRDVLDWPAADVAELLDTSVAAVNSALQRARATVEARRPRADTPGPDEPADAATHELLRRYVDAWERGDADALVAVLRDDATLTMPPVPSWFAGRHAIVGFLAPLWPRMGTHRAQVVGVCGGPGVAVWARAPGDDRFRAQAIHALTFDDGGAVAGIDAFMNPALFQRFGLPSEL
jgi:RNA polymerase sigma-70 factor (ECF subfamily)